MNLRDEYHQLSGHGAFVHIYGGYRDGGDSFTLGYVQWLEREITADRQQAVDGQSLPATTAMPKLPPVEEVQRWVNNNDTSGGGSIASHYVDLIYHYIRRQLRQ